MRVAVLLSVLAGCVYNPGSFAHPQQAFPGQRTTVGCLDVSVDRRFEISDAAVLEYQFGNRCDRPVKIDLASVPVIGRTVDGTELRLAPYDPRDEIIPLELDGRLAGGEAISYPAAQPLAQVCVDVAALAGVQPARWLCFGEAPEVAAAGRAADPELAHDTNDEPPAAATARAEEVTP